MQDKITVHEGECDLTDDIESEYDLDKMERATDQENRFRARAAGRMIQLDADVAAIFKDQEMINEILRAVITLLEKSRKVEKVDKAA
ncbi:MAG: hypothetical protein SF339_02060 [Blastocatellia bacterium]|nr:hypothetical protein [Blastocatellia bacterium]